MFFADKAKDQAFLAELKQRSGVLALSKTERLVLMAACGVLGLALGQRLFLLVGLGAGYKAFFATDFPAHPSRTITIYFIAVLIALGAIIRLMPGQGLGLN